MSHFKGFFRTFSLEEKSATDTRHMGARVPRNVSSSTSSAYGLRSWVDDDTGETWTLLTDPALGSWWYSLRTHRSQWHPPWALSLAVARAGGRRYEHAFMNPVVLQVINRMVDIPAACRSWYAQCTRCSRPWTLTGTVLGMVVMRLLLCNDRCPGWGAQKLWISAVAVLGGRAMLGYMFCIIQGGFWRNLRFFS